MLADPFMPVARHRMASEFEGVLMSALAWFRRSIVAVGLVASVASSGCGGKDRQFGDPGGSAGSGQGAGGGSATGGRAGSAGSDVGTGGSLGTGGSFGT